VDEESFEEYVTGLLLDAGWSKEEIRDITEEQTQQVMYALGESLARAREKTNTIVQEAAQKVAAIDAAYAYHVNKIADRDGCVGLADALQALTFTLAAKKAVTTELEQKLSGEYGLDGVEDRVE
jgi:hypothetical protein